MDVKSSNSKLKSELQTLYNHHGKAAAAVVLGLGLIIVSAMLWSASNRIERLKGEVAQLEARLAESRLQNSELQKMAERVREKAEAASREAEETAEALRRAEQEKEAAQERAEQALEQSEEAQSEAERMRAEAERIRREADEMRERRKAELDRMQQALSKIAEARRTPMGIVIDLGQDSFLFDFDKATLRPENREILSRIAGVLLASRGYRLYVYGHTDDVGSAEYNRKLSERRANAVKKYLVDAGIPAELIDAKGFGKSSPRVPGTTPEARQKNRRVEIGVVDTIIDYDQVAGEEGAGKTASP